MLVFYCNYALVYNNDLKYNMTLNCRRKVISNYHVKHETKGMLYAGMVNSFLM